MFCAFQLACPARTGTKRIVGARFRLPNVVQRPARGGNLRHPRLSSSLHVWGLLSSLSLTRRSLLLAQCSARDDVPLAHVRPGGRVHLHADRLAEVGRPSPDYRDRGGDWGERHHDPSERADAARGVPRQADRAVPGEPAAGAVPVQAVEVCGPM